MRKLLLMGSLVLLAVLLAGCTCCNFSTGTTTSTSTLGSYDYKAWDVSLKDGGTLTYKVSTNGGPLDIYILDQANYNLFKANSQDWEALQTDRADPSTSGTFEAPAAGTYYFVADNYNEDSAQVTADLKW